MRWFSEGTRTRIIGTRIPILRLIDCDPSISAAPRVLLAKMSHSQSAVYVYTRVESDANAQPRARHTTSAAVNLMIYTAEQEDKRIDPVSRASISAYTSRVESSRAMLQRTNIHESPQRNNDVLATTMRFESTAPIALIL